MLARQDVLRVIRASFRAERSDYARAVGRSWLEVWPHDLRVQYALAKAYAQEGQRDAALGVLTDLVSFDPEHGGGQRLLGRLAGENGIAELAALATGIADVLEDRGAPLAPWLAELKQGRRALAAADWEAARGAAQRAMLAEPASPLPSLYFLKSHWLAGDHDLVQPLAKAFAERWPKCVAFSLCLADCLLHTGDHAAGVEWLHTAASLDPAGEVVGRYWGRQHTYRELWPLPPTMFLPGPIPPQVASILGTNRLPAATAPDANGKTRGAARLSSMRLFARRAKAQKTVAAETAPAQAAPETLRDIEARLNQVAAELEGRRAPPPQGQRRRYRSRQYRRPVHVLLTSKRQLSAKYGAQAATELLKLITELARVTSQRAQRRAIVIMPDEFATLSAFGLDPVNPANPWEIKLLLHDLNARLAREGQTISSLLIVGGDDIVPFHRLPNPTDDVDPDVPSDNPYGAQDENYFVLDWAVGRLPAPCSPDPQPLADALQHCIDAHNAPRPRLPFPFGLLRNLLPGWQPGVDPRRSFGYSADVWKDASRSVYDAIGRPRDLLTSPPLIAADLPAQRLAPADFSYFNLHGLEDSPDWYGQRASLNPDEPLYPLALRPADVENSGRAPRIVLTEACYGAHILEKRDPDEALCLRFLTAGSLAVVGSTRLSYGSIAGPLIGADLLGSLFWGALLSGLPVGEALRSAKLELAQQMHVSQGFLDGEDQKTLISFVLYGDPLLQAPGIVSSPRSGKAAARANGKRVPKTLPRPICAKGRVAVEGGAAGQAEAFERVKSMVSRYLPGMEQCEISVHRPQTACKGDDHECPAASIGAKTTGRDPKQLVYTLSHAIPMNGRISRQYARVTLDARGEMIKMAVSR